ncbi:bifunctional 2-C-methyl-D-erythritol 4-phosphate cytidylyltransferase/2-C-methyl-D-erythritol 2,4-cyclodiphosphate synthase [Nitrosophilus alvini]|uniref:bifunctional 2-C-methyl-D-erythritol 4-phosphate cytidylyltransferase/2-C-methyl-D-erythritol 2,4-cyclodiphosphate synthase n=1 Tax=Nitrosophilus alvini TaxID=2714855 RepID=UPI00190BF538|nr:bifunctional 2-C-methyl-D-erythritol 4-phosphate cytidylyltransferase/2-C-methyl-D-erythritol 2,4-cyclodiphosphate synthase [Nitrosophilus alvini]
MSDLSLVLLGAGSSTRFGSRCKKQWLIIDEKPLWQFVAERFESWYDFDKTVITASAQEIDIMKSRAGFCFVKGGETRQESLKNALEHINTPYVLVSDIARVCIKKEIVENMISQKEEADCIVPYLKVSDTVVYKNETINRDEVKLIQTPQLSKTEILKKALDQKRVFTDDSSAVKSIGGKVKYIPGDKDHIKLTYPHDLKNMPCLNPPANLFFTGTGFDVHPFCKDRALMLGGVEITKEFGLKGHSDADVAIHALIDALMGAAAIGDIGELFPDTKKEYKDIDSKILLQKCVKLIYSIGYEIVNADLTIAAQKPKISPFKTEMQKRLSEVLQIPKSRINIKATTTEKLGFIGREEGIACLATATLKFYDWSKR